MNAIRRRAQAGDSRSTVGGYEAVDLGLPSGLLWATKNVEATREFSQNSTNPTQSDGDYYSYGAGSTANQTQYYYGMTNPLPANYDTATQVMGNGWRMPTKSEIQELFNNTTVAIHIVNGRYYARFASNANPDAQLNIPLAGIYLTESYTTNNANQQAYIWSSTPMNTDYAYAGIITGDGHTVLEFMRQSCISIRGVHAAV